MSLTDRVVELVLSGRTDEVDVSARELREAAGIDSSDDAEGCIAICQWVREPEWDDDSADYLEGHVDEGRLEQLRDGASPTDAEIALFHRLHFEQTVGGDSGWYAVHFCRITDSSQERSVYVLSQVGDWGAVLDDWGPFASVEAAEEFLREEGTMGEWVRMSGD